MHVTRLAQTGIAAPDGRSFPWGPIQRIHEIGDIQIVEYLDDRSRFAEGHQDGHGRTMFTHTSTERTRHAASTASTAPSSARSVTSDPARTRRPRSTST
jgi:hypothetical protein